jgi:hypothetical protein
MRLVLTWVARDEEVERGGAVVVVERAVGLSGEDLAEMQALAPEGVSLETEQGVVGKGAAGPGVSLVVVLEHILNDTASMIALAMFVKMLIGRVSRRRSSPPSISEPSALAVAALAAAPDEILGRARAGRFVHTVPVNTGGLSGTDARDIWAACWSLDTECSALLIFVSPAGMYLGSSIVPAQIYFDGSSWGPHPDLPQLGGDS